MTQLNESATRIQLRGLIAAVILAIILAIGITAGAFILSFSVLTDLARQAGIPTDLAWLFPLIVDGAILGATIGAVTLNKISGTSQGKAFFLWLLVAVVLISVAGNAYHAWSAAETAATALAPLPAALIAVIPPALILAWTHGIGILIKAIGNAYREDANAVTGQPADVATVSHTATAVAEPVPLSEPVAEPVAEPFAEPVAHGQPVSELLAFWAASELSEAVKTTAQLRIAHPDWTFARLAEETGAKAASTALRRYKSAEAAAIEAGFHAPPLPELEAPILVSA